MSFLVFTCHSWFFVSLVVTFGCCRGATSDEKIKHESLERCTINLNLRNVTLMSAKYSAKDEFWPIQMAKKVKFSHFFHFRHC